MHWPGFCGPSYVSRSVNVNAERSVNLYPEIIDSGTPKVKTWLVGTPGLKTFLDPSARISGPVRALFAQNGRAFAVIGGQFLEFFANGRALIYGDVVYDVDPATISSNGTAGNQLFIVSGGKFTIFNTATNVYTSLGDIERLLAESSGSSSASASTSGSYSASGSTAPDEVPELALSYPDPVVMGAFLDGYFIALIRNSRRFQISALENGLSWDGLDVGEVSTSGDNLRAMAVSHRELWFFGEHSTHVWYNSGYQSFPFQPISSVQIEHGILAPYSVVNIDNTLIWLGADKLGVGMVWRANGYTPERISTHAVEYWLSRKRHLDRAVAYAYQQEGHSFYVLYVPDGDDREGETTWVYDVATGFWHERATWDETEIRWRPHHSRCHCYAFNRHLVGDWASAQVYEMSLDLYDEDTASVSTVVTVLESSTSSSRSSSQSASASSSRSESRSGSSSISGSSSESVSGSASVSESLSESASGSLSTSASESSSSSVSESPSSSLSASASESMSSSLSESSSPSGA